MSAHWLYTIPLWLLALLLVAGTNALALGGVVLARRRGWRVREGDNESAGFLHAFLGVVYAVALGLIVAGVQDDYSDVNEATVREASAVGDLYRVLDGIGEPARSDLRAGVRQYVSQVIRVEWPAVRRGEPAERVAATIDGVGRHLVRFRPATQHDHELYPQLLASMQSVLDARRNRLIHGVEGIGGVTWLVIVLGGLITLGFACAFRMESRRAQVILTGLMGTSFALMVFLIIAMDHPLWGDLSIKPDAFEALETSFARQAAEEARTGAPAAAPEAAADTTVVGP
jgi:hypothetical protein